MVCDFLTTPCEMLFARKYDMQNLQLKFDSGFFLDHLLNTNKLLISLNGKTTRKDENLRYSSKSV